VAAVLGATGLTWPVFRDILAGFFQDNTKTAREIRSAEEEKDQANLLRMAHRLKGSAANIGAEDLRKSADAVEIACGAEESPDIVRGLIRDLLRELDGLLQQLQPLTEAVEDDDIDAGEHVLEGDPEVLLDSLTEAINRADPEAIQDLMGEVKKLFGSRKIANPSLIRILEIQTCRYDYDQALQTIGQIRNSMEKNQ
jgi:two-component system, sensor histidine kinase and response regulator